MSYKGASHKSQSKLSRVIPRRFGNFPDEKLTDEQYASLLKQKLQKIDTIIVCTLKGSQERKAAGALKRQLADELSAIRGIKPKGKESFHKIFIVTAKSLLGETVYNWVYAEAKKQYDFQMESP